VLDVSSNPIVSSYPESLEAWDELSRLSAQGAPIRLTGIDGLDPVEACILIDFFLHEPEASGPMEPFSTILKGIRSKEDVSLWDVLKGQSSGPVEEPAAGEPVKEHCQYYPLCHGYGASSGSCSTWQAILPRLIAAAGETGRP